MQTCSNKHSIFCSLTIRVAPYSPVEKSVILAPCLKKTEELTLFSFISWPTKQIGDLLSVLEMAHHFFCLFLVTFALKISHFY